ncbi:uncharacterized protein LOC8280775 [Ricinus communis]|uniref:Uncharacterized protein ycf33 n=1 Tax=Ricinus communis TaxID=3988 RepID=B9SA76_RICCO|nr:uncharacterized protein LOC8280775 [Ricinus communis]EEF39495.1 conserved hypothetical protein [Ricinus communis]|eukprot:XP_002522895.1 uncharacterized protein LOC8280775 [Ricinus communis]
MKTFTLRSQFHFLGRCTNLTNPTSNSPFLVPFKTKSHLKCPSSNQTVPEKCSQKSLYFKPICQKHLREKRSNVSPNGCLRSVVVGAASVGVVLFLMGMDEHKALALGPEGPLMEEFWDNVRRYALYALTVSTGALYTILQPIVELLKNPISAVLVIVIFGGSFYIVSQVLSAMFGITDFSYDYGY